MAQKRKTTTRSSSRKKSSNKRLWFLQPQRLNVVAFVLAFAAVGGFLLYRSFAATTSIIAAIQGENMTVTSGTGTVVNDSSANQGKALALTSAGSVASSTFSINQKSGKVALIAKAGQCNGSPSVAVAIAGQTVLTADLTSKAWTHYPELDHPVSAGNNIPITVTVTKFQKTPACASNVFIDLIRVHSSSNTGPGGGDDPVPYKASGNNDNLPTKVVFDDEFSNGLDKTAWAPVWFNNGSNQNDTTMNSSNVSVSNGFLVLHNSGNTGGLVSSNPTASNGQSGYKGFQFSYGYAEAKMCLPAASDGSVANWPAWWTDGQNWPQNGELDIMEGLSGSAQAHWHGPAGNGAGYGFGNGGHLTGCHIFAALWKPGVVTSYYDGKQLGTYSSANNITGNPQYLILENSVGKYGGTRVDNTDVKVDYVRVWQ